MPDSSFKIEDQDQDIQDILSKGSDFYNKLREILKFSNKDGGSQDRLNTYLFLLDYIPKEFRFN